MQDQRKAEQKPEFGYRVLIERRVLRALGRRKLADPSTDPISNRCDTDPDPREACRIKEKQKQKPEFGHRIKKMRVKNPQTRVLSRFCPFSDLPKLLKQNKLAVGMDRRAEDRSFWRTPDLW